MRFDAAIDLFLTEMQAEGRINSENTILSYRSRLNVLCDDIGNRDPRTISFGEISRTLARWPHPKTSQHARSVYISFFDWAMYKAIRKDNPARATRPRRVKAPNVYRLSRGEVIALFDACETVRETRAIRLGCCAGLRNMELRGMQLRHFMRPGAIWVSPDIAKGGRERYIPVIPELQEVVAEILATVGDSEYVIPGRRSRGGHAQSVFAEVPARPCSPDTLRRLVKRVALHAGIAAHIYPHLLRHAFGDHVTRQAGLRAAQATLGHASSATTSSTYTGAPTLDELTTALAFFRFADAARDQAPR